MPAIRKVSNDQATSYVHAGVQARGCQLGSRSGVQSYRSCPFTALRRWVNQLQEDRNGITPTSKALTPEQQKIHELEARINRLEREKSILKTTTALLMAEEQERPR